jgi:hypothetical protein
MEYQGEKMYLALVLVEWSQVRDEDGEELESSTGARGFLEVFDTREEAEQAYPNTEITELGTFDSELFN